MRKLTLYFAPGACSRVALIALEMIGVEFETELVSFMAGGHKKPSFKALNPSSKIPVLVADNTPISQNIAILTWLDETYPHAKLLPKMDSALERAQVLGWLSKFSSDLHPLVSRIRVPHFFCDIETGPERVAQLATKTLREQLVYFEDVLDNQPWLTGTDFTIIDAYLHWVWFRVTGAGFDPTDFPSISAHYAKTLKIPAVQKALDQESRAEAYLESQGLNPEFLKSKIAMPPPHADFANTHN
ncbi:glutathione S-transferase [Litorimonas cladophorae]|uniref:Glutathione S-transferase n=1 Tax=Litorimonas cladophorae TaxID=1220491 RepID=A0A918KHJ4_9PROT|nr:glutathione S-transferase family protein [Litorimonas cladophorae]GGX63175.1 glutathione S-transferase [Litorimonas cladophorae]